MANKILVTPEKLEQTANQFSQAGNAIKTATQQMTNTVKALSGQIWTGDASNMYNKKFNGLNDDIAKLNKMVQDHASDLKQIARNYKQAEQENVQAASSLSSDVII